MKKSYFLFFVIMQVLTIFYTNSLIEKNELSYESKYLELEDKIKELHDSKDSKYYCQSSLNFNEDVLGNSQTSFCRKKDARIWAMYQILDSSSKWSGMEFDIFEISSGSGVYYSVNFYD